MMPNLSKGAGIKGAALYVLHDERSLEDRAIGRELTPDQQTAGRVGFTATRNLSTDNPELAWRLMCATAKSQEELKRASGQKMTGRKAEKFCGHLSLSWEHQTQPDRAEMLRAADGALKALGWEKLQALIVQHKDHEHAHIHIVVNLVDPETGRIAPTSNDRHKVQEWADKYDEARGLNVAPNRRAKVKARERQEPTPERKRAHTRAEWEAGQRAANDDRPTPRTRAEKVDAYRAAVAQAREAMRPEWGEHYKQQRSEAAKLARLHREQRREFERAATPRRTLEPSPYKGAAVRATAPRRTELLAFYNRHRETIWRGLEGQKVTTSAALLSPAVMHTALEKAQAQDRAAQSVAADTRRAALVEKMAAARQQAQREIFWQHDRAGLRTRDSEAEATARARIDARRAEKDQARAEAAPQSQAERGLQDYAERRRHSGPGRHSPAERAAEAQERAQGRGDAARPQLAPEPPKPAQQPPQAQPLREWTARASFPSGKPISQPNAEPAKQPTPESEQAAQVARSERALQDYATRRDRQEDPSRSTQGRPAAKAPANELADELEIQRRAVRERMNATREARARFRDRDRERER